MICAASPTLILPGVMTELSSSRAAIEFIDDAVQYRRILRLCVGMKSGHHAAVAQLFGMNAHVSNGDHVPRPLAFFQVREIGKKNVRPQATMVDVQVTRSAVGGDEQWQNIKGARCGNLLQNHRFTSGLANKLQRFG